MKATFFSKGQVTSNKKKFQCQKLSKTSFSPNFNDPISVVSKTHSDTQEAMKNKENLTWFYNQYGSGFLNIISQDLCEKTPLLKNSQDKQEKYIAVFKNLQQELCQVKSDFWFPRNIRK